MPELGAFRPSLPLLVTVLSWGFNFVALKLIYVEVPAPALGLVRFVLMYGVLVAICRIGGVSLRYPKGDALRTMTMGFLAMGVYMVFFLEGMKGSTAAEGAIILATAPIFTSLFAAAAGQERLNLGALAGGFMSFAGVVLVILGGVSSGPAPSGKLLGNFLILASSAIWAASAVLSRPLVERHSPFRILTLSMPGAIPVLVPYGLMSTINLDWTTVSPISYLLLAHVAMLAGVAGFAGFYAGVRQVGAAGAMLYQFLVPPVAAAFAWATLGQAMTNVQFAGLVVVLTGVAIAMHFRRASAEGKQDPIEL